LNVRRAAASYRTGASLFARTVTPVFNDAGNVIETHEHNGDFKEP
jgi:hypothetical protein